MFDFGIKIDMCGWSVQNLSHEVVTSKVDAAISFPLVTQHKDLDFQLAFLNLLDFELEPQQPTAMDLMPKLRYHFPN